MSYNTASLNNKMSYEIYYSKDKTSNSTHVKAIIRTKTIIPAIHIHSTLATLHPLQGHSQSQLYRGTSCNINNIIILCVG